MNGTAPNLERSIVDTNKVENVKKIFSQDIIGAEILVAPADCKVIWMDEKLLVNDFPFLSNLDYFGLQKWVIKNCGWISQAQSVNNAVNKRVKLKGEEKIGYRPLRYGRAAIVEVDENVTEPTFIDIKGIGVAPDKIPELNYDSSGVLNINGGIVELIFERVLSKVFNLTSSNIDCVRTYAIIDLGFDCLSVDGSLLPSVCLARQAHERENGNMDIFPSNHERTDLSMKVEFFLRQFGITSSCRISQLELERDNGNLIIKHGFNNLGTIDYNTFSSNLGIELKNGVTLIDVPNIQLGKLTSSRTTKNVLYDFGQYKYNDTFLNPILFMVTDKSLNWGTYILPSSDQFITRNPRVSLNGT
ncbi:hypothetical protein F9L33_09575 [Amylibacter sp. SFDW26]|uniref:hypothetical protein n=1 Tax=Amylibacter sp. SFDW26 TaxID=2652722 RepID=UPI001261B8C1|nr:hypothetical protein [Amylibacter sp. SFDW26]KAB7613619.1 hypothetical protein F9L33_09575 [Amylibacter sp. SFDW26]